MEKSTRNNIIYGGIISLFGLILILSCWQVWTIYDVLWPPRVVRSFSLLPSALAESPWLFYDVLPILSWLPIFGGICIFIGVLFFFLETKIYKTLIQVGFILGIVMFGLFVFLNIIIFFLMTYFGLVIDLRWLGIPIILSGTFIIPTLNGAGGWMCIISSVGAGILLGKLKIPEYEEYLDEFVGLKQEEIKVHEKKVIKGSRKCPKCTNTVPGEQLFCEQCGHYF